MINRLMALYGALFLLGVVLLGASYASACPRINPTHECSVGVLVPDGFLVQSFSAVFLDGRPRYAERYVPLLDVGPLGFDTVIHTSLGRTGMAFAWTWRLVALNDAGDRWIWDSSFNPVFSSGPCACL